MEVQLGRSSGSCECRLWCEVHRVVHQHRAMMRLLFWGLVRIVRVVKMFVERRGVMRECGDALGRSSKVNVWFGVNLRYSFINTQ